MNRRLNLGCGPSPLPGFLNVDTRAGDVWAVAERLPFKGGSLAAVHASHVLEHVFDLDRVMRELHRVLRPGGILEIRVPFGLRSLYVPFHVHAFNLKSFDYFTTQSSGMQGGPMFELLERRISDWWLPHRWHLERYFPRLFRLISTAEEDGKRHQVLPSGVRQEVYVRLRKPMKAKG
jgi:ubiquinone/menaquinone biosynthesis C-methylase UbiE